MQITDETLWEYIDGTLPEDAKTTVDLLCRKDPAVSTRLEYLRDFHNILITGILPDKPSVETGQRMKLNILDALVLQKSLPVPTVKTIEKDKIITGIFLFFSFSLCLSLTVLISQSPLVISNLKENKEFFVYGVVAIIVLSCILADRYIRFRRFISRLNA